ncbi:hypothetical protein GF380_00340 [Candidatus Uhrbacteria bacterium]|nr:hypothetical protein [Candidatus Uhrbacteria bacterium]MBD3283864.1 hypothetical protein [Candidatus Uhrbacteria bacterium]
MTWLFIDTSERLRTRLAVFPKTGRTRVRIKAGRVPLVATMAAFITPDECSALQGIAVVAGPGSFSAVRSGVLVANLLSRVYHVPIYDVPKEIADDLFAIRKGIREGTFRSKEYVAPVYDAEPNITCPR